MQQLAAPFDGVAVIIPGLSLKTRSIHNFTIDGKCERDIVKIYYRYSKSMVWREVTKVQCVDAGTFQLHFEEPLAKIMQNAPEPFANFKRNKSTDPEFIFEFYGRTREYSTNVFSLPVTYLVERGRQGLASATENALTLQSKSGGKIIRIRGKVSSFLQAGDDAESKNTITLRDANQNPKFQIRSGYLRSVNTVY